MGFYMSREEETARNQENQGCWEHFDGLAHRENAKCGIDTEVKVRRRPCCEVIIYLSRIFERDGK